MSACSKKHPPRARTRRKWPGVAAALLLIVVALPSLASVIGRDDRETVIAYARAHGLAVDQVRERFAASGEIRCPDSAASGFLIASPWVVVTARHVLYPQIDLHSQGAAEAERNCRFVVQAPSGERSYGLDFGSAVHPDEKQRGFVDNRDWVVLRLKEPVVGVSPYRLPSRDVSAPEHVVAATEVQDDMVWPAADAPILEECAIMSVRAIYDPSAIIYETNCSQQNGASGGVLLRLGARTTEALAVSTAHALKDCPAYRPGLCSSVSIPIEGDFLQSILRLAGEN